jgi:urease beta subunit
MDRPYERMNITGLTGVADAQRQKLLALGAYAIDQAPARTEPWLARCLEVREAHVSAYATLRAKVTLMIFLFGVAIGAVGMWAYKGGKLQSLLGGAPEPMQQAFQTAGERINQVATNPQLREVASTVQDRVQQATGPRIEVPSATEVATRPSEPLPRQEPEGLHVDKQ